MRSDLLNLKLEDLVEIPGFNVRHDMGDIKGLAMSIAEVGIKVPLRGYKLRDGENAGKYAIVNGHRRFAAAQLVVKDQPDLRIPLQPESSGYTEEDRTVDLIVTNEGNKLTMLEESEVIERLVNFGWDRQKIAAKIGKTDQHVADLETLLTATPKVKKLIKKNQVSASAVVSIIRDKDGDMEQVEGALEKAMEKAGSGKKVTPKHVEKTKKPTKPTLAVVKDVREELENIKPSNGNKRLELFDLIISFLNGEISEKTFIKRFFPEPAAK